MTISIFPTMAAAQAAALSSATSVQLMGYYDDGDCDGRVAVYENVGMSAPSIGTNGYGWFESADGYYFLLTNNEVDARMFGAKADGSTDNATYLNALETWCGVDPNTIYYDEFGSEPGTKTIVFGAAPSAICIGSPIFVFSGVAHRFEMGAEVKALSPGSWSPTSTPAQAAMFVGAGSNYARWVTFEGPGTINCNGVANLWGVQAYQASSWSINGKLRIINADGGGVLGGALSGTSGAGYNINIDDIRISGVEGTYPASNNSAGVGIYYKQISDSRVHRAEAIGLYTGFRSDQGDTTFDDCHCWTGSGYGPLVYGFYISDFVECVNCYADTVTNMQNGSITATYGFYSSDGGGNCINCSVFLNYDNGSSTYTSGICTAFYNASNYVGQQVNIMTVDGGVVTSVTAGLEYAAIFGGALHSGNPAGVLQIARTVPLAVTASYVSLGDEAFLREPLQPRVSARKNRTYIANGALQLWQRYSGTAISIPSSTPTWAADRWQAYATGSAVLTMGQDTISPAERGAYGIRSDYALQLSLSSGTATEFVLSQLLPVETLYELAGKSVCFQMKYKAVSGSGTPTVTYGVNYGSGGSSSVYSGMGGVVAATTAYQTYFGYATIPALTSLITLGAGAYFEIIIGLPLSGPYAMDFCDFMLTKGQENCLFEGPDPVENQIECFNYYEVVNAEGFSGTSWYPCTVKKRNATSLSIAHGGGGTPALVGSCQQNGALVSDTAIETLTLTFSCAEP
jgi:hypothetical protein